MEQIYLKQTTLVIQVGASIVENKRHGKFFTTLSLPIELGANNMRNLYDRDTASTRIPRLDGGTRIPMPGSLRVTQESSALARPKQYSGMLEQNLVKSSSGDRLNNAMSAVSKKTTTAFKKIFSKSTKSTPILMRKTTASTPTESLKIDKDETVTIAERTAKRNQFYTRSSTFVRSDSMLDVMQISRLPTTTTMMKKNEAQRKSPLNQMNYYQHKKGMNTTVTYKSTETKFHPTFAKDETVTKSRTSIHEPTTFTVSKQKTLDLLSPMTNATYSNSGSADNLMNLEDVSMPSGLDLDTTLQAAASLMDVQFEDMNDSLPVLAPNKAQLKLPLNSTMNTERLIDLTTNEFNFSKEFLYSPRHSMPARNCSKLMYMTLCSASKTPDRPQKLMRLSNSIKKNATPAPNIMSPLLMKGAQSDLVLPTCTPVDEQQNTEQKLSQISETETVEKNQAISLQDINKSTKFKPRLSFGMNLTESALDCCSLELIDVSLSSTAQSQSFNNRSQKHKFPQSPSLQALKKQNSFELDESLGILTPDQMKGFLDSTATSHTNNMELPLNSAANNRLTFNQMRMEQTPSPEELPLDPVEVKTDISDFVQALQQRQHVQQQTQDSSQNTETDQMVRSNVSKISTSFITSVTSVTSLDTGYQGDGEMSRPASRGASDHSPSNGPIARKAGPVSRQPSFNQMQQMPPPIRRQDLMTDSDFFTESEADDAHHRGGDRRAQVIDGQLYGPTLVQSSASVFITEHPQMEDSCMESSGIFTDVENRCEEDLAIMRRSQQQANQELSPDGECDDSTETVKSIRTQHTLGQGQLADAMQQKQILSLPQSCSNDRLSTDTTLSNRTSYCSVDGTNCKSFCSLEETAFNYKQQTNNELTTGTKSFFSDQLAKQQSYNQTVDNLSSPRKHASLTSLTLSENTQTSYFANKSAIKSASGTAIYEQISDTTVAETVTKVSTLNKTTKVKNSSVKISSPKALSPKIKSNVPNKWEAVMNKIATNKATQVRKNYNDVKSKVSTRNVLVSGENSSPVSSSISPRTRCSPTANSSSVLRVLQTNSPKLREATNNNANVLKTKRFPLQNATKR